MRNIVTKRFDMEGLELSRLAKFAFCSKVLPMGNFRGGPGARCLIVLTFLHYFGYLFYLILARFGHRLHFLRRIAAKLKA